MAAGEQGDEEAIDDALHADDDARNLGLGALAQVADLAGGVSQRGVARSEDDIERPRGGIDVFLMEREHAPGPMHGAADRSSKRTGPRSAVRDG